MISRNNMTDSNVYQRPANPDVFSKAIGLGLTNIEAEILSRRIDDPDKVEGVIGSKLSDIPDPYLLTDMDKGAQRLAQAIQDKEHIWVFSDFDNDGIGGIALFAEILEDGFDVDPNKVLTQISHRDNYGYGFMIEAAKEFIEKRRSEGLPLPGLVVTIDLGSSNENDFAELKQMLPNIDIIVTDHHGVPKTGGPTTPVSFINPNRQNDKFPDKTVCGATVAFLLLLATKKILKTEKSISKPLSYAASSTIADCVSMQSPVNRAIVKFGLEKMNQMIFPAWHLLKTSYCDASTNEAITSHTLGWKLGPLINSNSRMGNDGSNPYDFLRSKTTKEAHKNLESMVEVDKARKARGEQLLAEALDIIEKEGQEKNNAIIVHFKEGVPGIAGIIASRLKEKYGKPVIMLTSTKNGLATGSARGIPGIDLVNDLIYPVKEMMGDNMVSAGGHEGAAGLKIKVKAIKEFKKLIVERVDELVNGQKLTRKIGYDLDVSQIPIDHSFLDVVNRLQPFGQKFEEPCFIADATITKVKLVGEKKNHAQLVIQTPVQSVKGIMFSVLDKKRGPLIYEGDTGTVIFKANYNRWNGRVNVQFIVEEFIKK